MNKRNEQKTYENRKCLQEWFLKYKTILVDNKNLDNEVRRLSMNKVNPKFVLRNHLMENAIKSAETSDDYSLVNTLLELSQNPFNEELVKDEFTQKTPDWAFDLCVSCSS